MGSTLYFGELMLHWGVLTKTPHKSSHSLSSWHTSLSIVRWLMSLSVKKLLKQSLPMTAGIAKRMSACLMANHSIESWKMKYFTNRLSRPVETINWNIPSLNIEHEKVRVRAKHWTIVTICYFNNNTVSLTIHNIERNIDFLQCELKHLLS